MRTLRFESIPALVLAGLLITAFAVSLIVRHVPQSIGVYGSQHVHADFLVRIGETTLDFSSIRYQSTNVSPRSPITHLHDGNGHVVHSHATGVTWGMFFQSIGFSLNSSCLMTDVGTTYCTNATHALFIRTAGRPRPQLAQQEIRDLERVLIAYLPKSEINKLNKLLAAVTDEACIHSGKCPERGVAPAESGCSSVGDCIAPREETHG